MKLITTIFALVLSCLTLVAAKAMGDELSTEKLGQEKLKKMLKKESKSSGGIISLNHNEYYELI
jgi:hypothetical protein